MGVKEVKGRKYELVPPDGGWGYMIGLGVTINLITISGFLTCFGVIYKELFIELGIDSTTITLLNGVSAACIAVSGIFTAPILKILSIRQFGFIVGVIYNLGVFGAVFVKSKFSFFLFVGILQSIGNGIIFNLSCTVLNSYFVKKRLLAVSLTQTFVGVAGLVSPQFVKWSLETFGFKGTLLLIAGISFQNMIGMTLLQPVKWHMKKVEVPEDKEIEKKSLLATDEKPLTSKENVKVVKSSELDKEASKEKCKYEEKQRTGIKYLISNLVDPSLFKTFLLSNASVGTALSVFSECTYIIMLPQALYAMGWSEGDVAWALSLNAMGDLATRVLLIFMNNWLLKVGSHEMYVMGLVVAFVSRLGMLWSDNRTVMTIFMTIMGISRCTIMILMQVVVADSVDQDKFSAAMGLVLLLYGFFTIVVGPLIGAVRDLTDSYSTAFYILISCYGIVIMFWTIELIYKKNKHKRQPKDSSKV